jgi:hypothetical protein
MPHTARLEDAGRAPGFGARAKRGVQNDIILTGIKTAAGICVYNSANPPALEGE